MLPQKVPEPVLTSPVPTLSLVNSSQPQSGDSEQVRKENQDPTLSQQAGIISGIEKKNLTVKTNVKSCTSIRRRPRQSTKKKKDLAVAADCKFIVNQ